jgi:uncharacterized protein (DUF169 family)
MMISLSKIDDVLSTFIKPQNYPLDIKMLKEEDEIPQDAKRPLGDYGGSFTLCQALALGRREGSTIVLDKESQSCPIALVGLGFVKPEAYLRGDYALVPFNQSPEARVKAAEATVRFPFGKFNHILISPIGTANLDPDVILIYGNGAQVMRMIQAAAFTSGESVTSRSIGSGGCLLPIVSPILDNECKFTIPGNGERRMGLIADGEMAFAMPKSRFEDVVNGLKLSHEGGQNFPFSPGYLKLECKMPPSYEELRKTLIGNSK